MTTSITSITAICTEFNPNQTFKAISWEEWAEGGEELWKICCAWSEDHVTVELGAYASYNSTATYEYISSEFKALKDSSLESTRFVWTNEYAEQGFAKAIDLPYWVLYGKRISYSSAKGKPEYAEYFEAND